MTQCYYQPVVSWWWQPDGMGGAVAGREGAAICAVVVVVAEVARGAEAEAATERWMAKVAA